MAVKLIALDLDGTTLNKAGKLSPGNRKALEYAIEKGAEVVIASGRPLAALPQDVCAVEGVRYAITSNGASVWYLPEMKCIRRFHLTAGSVETVLRLVREEGVSMEVFVSGQAYAEKAYVDDPTAFGAPERAIAYVQSTRKGEEDLEGFVRRHMTELESVDIIVADPEKKDRLWQRLKEETKDLYITSSVKRLLELSYKDSGKHGGVRFVRKLLSLSAEEVAAFGDGDNDIEMLTEAGIGVAMANATEKCLAAANVVTAHHDEDGVAKAIYELF